jgi:hypothetical protein
MKQKSHRIENFNLTTGMTPSVGLHYFRFRNQKHFSVSFKLQIIPQIKKNKNITIFSNFKTTVSQGKQTSVCRVYNYFNNM